MGLLDFDSPDTRLGLGLLAAASARSDGAGFGQRLAEAVGSVDQWKQQQQMQKVREMQIQYQQALMADHQQKLIAEQRANEIAARKQAALPTIFSAGSAGAPAINIDAALPPEMRTGVGVQPAIAPRSSGVDVQRALMAGYSPKEIEELDKLRNVGLDKVARTVQGQDETGKPVTFQMDDFGRKIGMPVAEWKAPVLVNQGNKETFVDPVSLTARGSLQKFQSPDSAASNWVTMRGQDLVDARKREELQGAETAFSPEAIANAAARYNIDGTLPPMGMGKTGSMGRSAILNKAAELARGVSGEDQRVAQIDNKAASGALTKLVAQQTMISAFEKNAVKNADMALELSAKVDRTGVPILNTWIQAGQKSVTGNPEVAQFHAATETFVNEYAKIMSGSMGNTAVSDSARAHAHSLLSTAQTPQTYAAVVSTLKQEMSNRMAGLEEEKQLLRSSMKPRTSTSESTPAPVKVRRFNLDGTEIKD